MFSYSWKKRKPRLPGKNLYKVNDKPIAWYPMTAAIKAPEVGRHFISTDDSDLADLGKDIGFEVIERPSYLATPEALGEDAYKHGYEVICSRLGFKPELLVLLFCNAPTVRPQQISYGIKLLRENLKLIPQ